MRELDAALATGDDALLRAALVAGSNLPGPRLNLALVWAFADAVGDVISAPDPPVAALEDLLDGWAALPESVAGGNAPEVVLPCAAIAAYGVAGAVRPDWWDDEVGKLRRAAADPRWRVRELVAQAVQRILEADWDRMVGELAAWADDPDLLVVRAAAASVAEPRLLTAAGRAEAAVRLQRAAVERYRAAPREVRRSDAGRALRKGLGFTVSVAVAASRDRCLLDELAASGDADLRWIAKENLGKARLRHLRGP